MFLQFCRRSRDVPIRNMKSVKRPRSFSTVARSSGLSGADCVIIGGGVIGSSIAYFLKRNIPDSKVTVIEKDCSYRAASTPLSVGGFRLQFSVPENMKIGMFSSNFIRNINDEMRNHESEKDSNDSDIDLQFFEEGYLVLANSENSSRVLQDNAQIQQSFGAETKLESPEELKHRFAWLNVEDLTMGSLGMKYEGWLDPWTLLQTFRAKARERGVIYSSGRATGFETSGNRVSHVCLENGDKVPCNTVINASGAWSGYLNNLLPKELRVNLPVVPRKRSVFVFSVSEQDAKYFTESNSGKFPLVVDPSGAYFRRDGKIGSRTFLCGKSPAPEADVDYSPTLDINEFETQVKTLGEDDYAFFETYLWPTLANRVPAFENIKVQQGWSGFYDYNTLDQNAIVGKHPVVENMYACTGFSGHGLQQSPAVGMAISELIEFGEYRTIDLNAFGFDRIQRNKPLLEKNIY